MAAKPNIPVTRREMYLDVMTGGSSSLPEPVTIEEKYLAKIAGMSVDLPTPVPIKYKFLAKIAGMQVDVPTYTTGLPRIYAYLAKAAGQDVEVPQPITREEMYWFDYVGGQPTPSEQEYTGAVPVTFTANGQPLLDYLISGNTVQSGTPTPDNPIMPEGTGERAENLFNVNGETYLIAPSITIVNNGILFENVPAGNGARIYYSTQYPAGSYYISCVTSGYDYYATRLFSDTPFPGATYNTFFDAYYYDFSQSGFSTILTFDNDFKLGFGANAKGGSTFTISDIMLSTTEADFEPYGYKIPISLANAITPIYLGEGEKTRRIKKSVLTGEEEWNDGTQNYYTTLPKNGIPYSQMYCSHNIYGACSVSDDGTYVWVEKDAFSDYTTIADWKSYLAAQYANGTPVTIWYVLAEPETAVINEPLMKIGDYADTLSMEQAGVQIPTVNGSNTLDVLTTVKPSEVYIKYKGEPVAGSQTSSLSSAYAPAEVSDQSENVDDINSNLLGKEEETE